MKLITFLALVLCTLCCTQSTLHAEESPRPNIVFIMADDLGWTDLGCFGSQLYQTPNVDALAARGMKFTQAYAANPLCSPTRSSVLTGLWPARTGITSPSCHIPLEILDKGLAKGNPKTRVLVAESVTRLKTDYVTLPKVLREAGYRTGHFGKWHLGKEPYSPLQHGFEVDFPHWSGPGPAGSYVAPWKFPDTLHVDAESGEHIEDRTAAEAAKFIHENKDRPFYLNYWQFSVHAPYDAKDELVAKYRALVDAGRPQRNPVYAAMIESLDAGVGHVLKAIDDAGLREKTIIVFFSDNGGISWGGPGSPKEQSSARFQEDMKSAPTSNLPLRNGKASLYEGGVRVPCLVVWPGVVPAGSTSETVVQSIDWFPTLLEMVNLPVPETVTPDGLSIVPALKGGELNRDAIFCHFPHDTPASGQHPGVTVRRGDWKLLRLFARNDDGSDRLELYNLREDVGEQNDLAASHPDLCTELNLLIDGFLHETSAVIPKLNPNYTPTAATVPAPSTAADDPLFGWKTRSCEASVKDGVLIVSGIGGSPFLGVTAAKFKKPQILKIRIRCQNRGSAEIELRPPPSTSTEARKIPYSVQGGTWEELTIQLPEHFPLSILRVHLPAKGGTVELDWIELQAASDSHRWDF